MRNRNISILILLFTTALVACGSATDFELTDSDVGSSSGEPVTTSGTGRMGMGGGMMDRHHATIPEEYAGASNPIAADEASLERGREIYVTNCASCHGDGGVGDGPAGDGLDPAPAAIVHTSQMLGDNYQFWRVSEGGAMEPFNSSMIAWKGVLDEQARWDVINYVQALGSGVAVPMEQVGGAAFDPEVQAAKEAQMLADAVEQGVITEEEAAVFAEAHVKVDGQMMQMQPEGANSGMDEMMADILAALFASGELTQEQADTFLSVHDRLGEAGLMQ